MPISDKLTENGIAKFKEMKAGFELSYKPYKDIDFITNKENQRELISLLKKWE